VPLTPIRRQHQGIGSGSGAAPSQHCAPRQRRCTQPPARPQAAARFPGIGTPPSSGGSSCSTRLHLVQLGARDSKVASSFISGTAAVVASPSFRSTIKVCALKPYQLYKFCFKISSCY
jgi:hypothetical protein